MYSTERIEDDLELIRLESLFGRLVSYSFHVAYVDGLLVDSGFARSWRSLASALRDKPVHTVINTHAHEDHFGNNAALARRFGARLWAPAASLEAMEHPERWPRRWYQRTTWGEPAPCRPQPLPEVVQTKRYRFQVIPTPGHCRDHVCFFEPDRRWLFTGDLFLSVKVRIARPIENSADLLTSLERVRRLEPRVLLCAHRGAIFDPRPRLDEKIAFVREVGDRIRELHASGVAPDDIRDRVLGPESLFMRLVTGFDVSKRNLVYSFLKEPGQGYTYEEAFALRP